MKIIPEPDFCSQGQNLIYFIRWIWVIGSHPMIATLSRPVRDSDHRPPRGTGLAARAFWRPFPVVIPSADWNHGAHSRLGFGRVSPDLHCRFWLGLLGGGGLSPLPACGSNLRVTLMASWLISRSERRPSSIRAPERLLKLSASSRMDFTFSNSSSAFPSARLGTTLSILVMALSKPEKAASALRMMLSIASPLPARSAV